jgi:hypothetical protein
MPESKKPDEPDCLNRSFFLLEWVQQQKMQQRSALGDMDPRLAQEMAQSVFNPRQARVVDPRQLSWPGDLADAWDEAYE